MLYNMYTVEPVYVGHQRCSLKASNLDRCPTFSGAKFQCCVTCMYRETRYKQSLETVQNQLLYPSVPFKRAVLHKTPFVGTLKFDALKQVCFIFELLITGFLCKRNAT